MHTLDQLRAGTLQGSTRLRLRAGLTTFPREIFDLAETLEILDLSGNELSALPDDLPRLSKLRVLFCSDNAFTALPAMLSRCPALTMVGFKANRIRTVSAQSLPPQLRWLILTDNQIEELPAALGACSQLQKLMLAGNRLRTLPVELAACSQLELLRIAANQLEQLPLWLLALPKLTWLAYAGNPFCAQREQTALSDTVMSSIGWDRLQIEYQLGEGASGVIQRAVYWHGDEAHTVAVKLFKGALTSDGLPRSEMAACMAAGQHPHLIALQGQLIGHPSGLAGLVMALVDPALRNLAQPPSLESCTRDIYPPEQRFGLAVLLAIAHAIASAASHLHRRGILHGDLYGHNILHDERGHSLLGDFGAASFYPPEAAYAPALQRLEVRAFACLLEELLERCPAPATAQPILQHLQHLKTACLHSDPAQRPLFAAIEHRLAEFHGQISEGGMPPRVNGLV